MIKNLIVFVGLMPMLSCSVNELNEKPSVLVREAVSEKQLHKAHLSSDRFELKIIPNLILNQKNYLIDFDGDGEDELVTLEESYSRPNFYKFIFTKKEFKNLKLESSIHRASFLKINPRNNHLGVYTFFQNNFMPPGGGFIYKIIINNGVVTLDERGVFNAKAQMPLSSIVDYEPTGDEDRKPMTIYFHWLKNIQNKLVPVIDQFDDGGGARNLNIESKELANYGASLCDVDEDNNVEVILSATSDDDIQFLDYNSKIGFQKKRLFPASKKISGIFASCFFPFNQSYPNYIIGKLNRSYFKKKKSSGLFNEKGDLIFDFNLNENAEVKNIIPLDLNGDVFWDFVIENNGSPPDTKLEVYVSQNGNYKKLEGINIINPSGVVYSDFNKDGKIDLLFGRSTKRAPFIQKNGGILFNNIKQRGRSLRIFFDGHKNYKDAEGGIIEVITSGGVHKKVIQYQQGGLSSQSSRFIQFGLGSYRLLKAKLRLGSKEIKYDLRSMNKEGEITLCPKSRIKKGRTSCG